ncbi:MAG: TIGR01777 family oxidoreductase [Opitutaceae bacterium]
MEKFTFTTRIERPAAEVFAWHERPGALGRLCPPWERVELVSATGGVRDGARVVVRNRRGPFSLEWHVEHRGYVPGREFRDVQLSGPFASWEHLHRVTPDGANACLLTDDISYRLPGGAAGRLLGGAHVRRELARLFGWRHATTKADLELAARYDTRRRRVVVAGASGLLGGALVDFLRTQGHEVVRLLRRGPAGSGEALWNPARGELAPSVVSGADAVVNLSGENVGAGRWSAARREAILRSRVDATRTLVAAMKAAEHPPEVFVSASAVGFYGDRGDEVLTEGAAIGSGFLPEVCLAWETHADVAARAGIRTVLLRFGVVLTPAGGALAKMLPVFRLAAGGRVGSGRQWMSWIGREDAIGAVYHAIMSSACRGPMNACAPGLVTNAVFTRELASAVGRPALFPVPAFVLRAAFGQMADETLLASTRAAPAALLESGYRFRHADIGDCLRHELGAAPKT